MFYVSETCIVKGNDVNRFEQTENNMVRWICSAKDGPKCEKLKSM